MKQQQQQKKQETFSFWGRKTFPIDSVVYLSGNVVLTRNDFDI